MSEETKEKPGYKTTEFWLATAANILSALFASGVVSDGSRFSQVLGVAAMILTTLGYTVLRSKAKALPAGQ